jgi:hypothetical protein
VTGGLWPAELSTVTEQTAPLVKYLKADLQKIVDSANEELLASAERDGLIRYARQKRPEWSMLIAPSLFGESSRQFANLRTRTPQLSAENRPLKLVNGGDDTEKTQRFKVVAVAPPKTDSPAERSATPRPQYPDQDQGAAAVGGSRGRTGRSPNQAAAGRRPDHRVRRARPGALHPVRLPHLEEAYIFGEGVRPILAQRGLLGDTADLGRAEEPIRSAFPVKRRGRQRFLTR